MAGLGFKDFQVGEVLTSSDVDGYLMQQTVMRFADSGARGSALGTAPGTAVALAEGMMTYLDSLNAVQVYDGSGWRDPSIGIGSNVVQTVKTGVFSTTSTSFTDVTGMSVAITPTSATSKVLIVAQFVFGASGANVVTINLRRDSTDIAQSSQNQTLALYPGSTGAWGDVASLAFVDSPATTSATTYKLRMKVAANTAYLGRYGTADVRSHSSLIAVEVAA